jgi:hypothetical protein
VHSLLELEQTKNHEISQTNATKVWKISRILGYTAKTRPQKEYEHN